MRKTILDNLDTIIRELKKGNDIQIKANKDDVKILVLNVKKI